MLVWKQSGYFMIFYLSGLQNIPAEVYEAAKMDGAGSFRIFRSITWPLLRPITLFAFIIALTDSYKMVDYLYLMTDGGPNNSSNMLLYYVYQTGFNFWDIGKASTITSILVAPASAGLGSKLFLGRTKRFFTAEEKCFMKSHGTAASAVFHTVMYLVALLWLIPLLWIVRTAFLSAGRGGQPECDGNAHAGEFYRSA